MSEIFDLLSPSGELATQKEFQALMAGSEAHSAALGEGIAALLSVTAHAYKEGWTLGYTETSPSDKQDTGSDSSVEGIEPIVSE